ncbi:MAG: hypothetical protein HYU64_06345 [Armatimonadetes bacterium]|nr:hypothetical protein [Armatimonadota bacterium]
MTPKARPRLYWCILFVILTLSCLAGCTISSNTTPSPVVLGGAQYDAANGTFAMVGVYRGTTPISDAAVTVNGASLPYGLAWQYQGKTMDTLPVYFGQVVGTPGSVLTLNVTHGGNVLYNAQTTIPGVVAFASPTAGQMLFTNQNINGQWNAAAGAAGYYLDYTGSGDAYYGVFTTGTSWTIPSSSLTAGQADFTISALSNSLGLSNGTVFTGADDETGSSTEESGIGFDTSGWVAVTTNELNTQINQGAGRAGDVSSPLPRAQEGMSVAQVTYINKDGIRLKQNQYNPIQAPAQGRITFTLRFERWAVAVGGWMLIDGATGGEKGKWSHKRIMERKRKKYSFDLAAQQGDVLVIFEHKVDTIWGPTFNY